MQALRPPSNGRARASLGVFAIAATAFAVSAHFAPASADDLAGYLDQTVAHLTEPYLTDMKIVARMGDGAEAAAVNMTATVAWADPTHVYLDAIVEMTGSINPGKVHTISVIDGTHEWVQLQYPNTDQLQVIKKPVTKTTADGRTMRSLNLGPAEFVGLLRSEVVFESMSQDGHVITLEGRFNESFLESPDIDRHVLGHGFVRLLIDPDGRPLSATIGADEANRNARVSIDFVSFRSLEESDRSLFSYTPPEGVTVVEQDADGHAVR